MSHKLAGKMHMSIKRWLLKLQRTIIDPRFLSDGAIKTPRQFGKFKIPEYCFVIPSSSKSSRRKPITENFQLFLDIVIFPVIMHIMFGDDERVIKHLSTMKINTLQLVKQPENVYHMHLDGKVNILNKNDKHQKHVTRFLTSILPDDTDDGHVGTVYLKPELCPMEPFRNIKQFHEFMSSQFPERGISTGNLRPLYELDPSQVHRIKSGDLMVHRSHDDIKCQIPHSEPNPYPIDHRYTYVFDFVNIRDSDNYSPIPEQFLIESFSSILMDAKKIAERIHYADIMFSEKLNHFQKTLVRNNGCQ